MEVVKDVVKVLVAYVLLYIVFYLFHLLYCLEMKKRYTIQVDDKVFVDICALRRSMFDRSVTFDDIENGVKVTRHLFYKELHVMKLEKKKNEE